MSVISSVSALSAESSGKGVLSELGKNAMARAARAAAVLRLASGAGANRDFQDFRHAVLCALLRAARRVFSAKRGLALGAGAVSISFQTASDSHASSG